MTKSLLGYGVIAGPFYIVVSLAQALTRDGFDLTRHAWSLRMPTMNRVPPDRWPTVAGIATVPVLVLGILDDVAEGVVVAAVLYLAGGCCGVQWQRLCHTSQT